MQIYLFFLFHLFSASCQSQGNEREHEPVKDSIRTKWIISNSKTGEKQEIEIKDSALLQMMNGLLNGKKPSDFIKQNDTIKNEAGIATKIMLADSFFGASYQIPVYDKKSNLVKLTVFNGKGELAPFLPGYSHRNL